MILPPLPSSWAALTWQQLCDCWTAKLRYGGNGDVARCAALLAIAGLTVNGKDVSDSVTGEATYRLSDADGRFFTVTPRQLAYLASRTMKWFDFPYGDRGEEEVKAASKREQNGTGSDSAEREQARPEGKDEQGNVIKEGRAPVFGYVNPNWRDAMELPEQEVVVCGRRIVAGSLWEHAAKGETPVYFSLPEKACTNVTWHQYRSLQGLTQMMFQDGIDDATALGLQAQFLAYILVPEQQDGAPLADRFGCRHKYRYDADRAEQTVVFWRSLLDGPDAPANVLYALCFQTYQTALHYYEKVFPLLFHGSGKEDPLHDALTGEVDTINCVMKYQGYTDPQQVYDANLPIILSVLNTMTKEAKEIEKMNAKIKRKN